MSSKKIRFYFRIVERSPQSSPSGISAVCQNKKLDRILCLNTMRCWYGHVKYETRNNKKDGATMIGLVGKIGNE